MSQSITPRHLYDPGESFADSLKGIREDQKQEREGSVRRVRTGRRLVRHDQAQNYAGCSTLAEFVDQHCGFGIGQARKYMRVSGLSLVLLEGTDLSVNVLDRIVSLIEQGWQEAELIALAVKGKLPRSGTNPPGDPEKQKPGRLAQRALRLLAEVVRLLVVLFGKVPGQEPAPPWAEELDQRIRALVLAYAMWRGVAPQDLWIDRRQAEREGDGGTVTRVTEEEKPSQDQELNAKNGGPDEAGGADGAAPQPERPRQVEKVARYRRRPRVRFSRPPSAARRRPRPPAASPPPPAPPPSAPAPTSSDPEHSTAAAPASVTAPTPGSAATSVTPMPAAPAPTPAPEEEGWWVPLTRAVVSVLTLDEQKTVQEHLVLGLAGKHPAPLLTFLRTVLPRLTDLPAPVKADLDAWFLGAANPLLARRFEYLYYFFITAQLPRFRIHLHSLTVAPMQEKIQEVLLAEARERWPLDLVPEPVIPEGASELDRAMLNATYHLQMFQALYDDLAAEKAPTSDAMLAKLWDACMDLKEELELTWRDLKAAGLIPQDATLPRL